MTITAVKRRHGTVYRVRVEVAPDPATGRRRWASATLATRKEAERQEARWVVEAAEDRLPAPDATTVGDLSALWLTDVIADRVRPTTLDVYRRTVKGHIVPGLGGTRVQKLTPAQVERFYAERRRAGVGTRTVQVIHRRLSQIMATAVRWGLVARNPCDAVDAPVDRPARGRTWEAAHVRTFLAAAADASYAPLWDVLVGTGLRRGEALGLRWQDVDLTRGRIRVVQTVSLIDGAPAVQPPKTAAAGRTVSLPAEVVERLREHRRSWLARRLAAAVWEATDLVFCTRTGGALNPRHVLRAFDALVTAAGLPDIRIHDLRHTHASMLLGAGVPIAVVSQRLGHARVSITLDTYAHVIADVPDGTADVVSAAWYGPGTTTAGPGQAGPAAGSESA